MNWFYALDGQQIGPVSDPQLEALLRSGKINRDTLVWREGMTDWQALSMVRPCPPQPIPGTQSGIDCVECGKTFPPGDLIQLNRSWVCAQCKPVFLQRLSEGGAMPSTGGLWRMNKRLVTRSETVFPDRCTKCNAPANGFRLKRTLYWQHPAYYFLLLCNLLILLIVILIVRKKAILHIGLCEQHRKLRLQAIAICWIGVLGGVGALIAGVAFESWWTALVGLLLLLGGAIYGAVRGTTVTATKIDKEHVWIKGVHPDFLAELPEWLGS